MADFAPGVIVGHSNMDLDCFGSIALARYLFPGYTTLQSRHVHPGARKLATMFRNHLQLVPTKDFKGQEVEHLVVLDTRSRDRIQEYLDLFRRPPARIDVYDHHPGDSRDIPGATFHESILGSNTTFLGTLLMERGIRVAPDDATVALTGVYADTGNFTHGNVSARDFEVAAYLLAAGASIQLVKTFLSPLREKPQIAMFHEVLNDLVHRDIRGHSVLLSYTEMDGPTQGLSPVVEKIFEVENPDAYFAVFFFKHNDSVVIISRNQKDGIELDRIMGAFGGGGHKMAASATVKKVQGREVFQTLLEFLESSLRPAITAQDIMTREVKVIPESTSLLDAALFLEETNHTGFPVVDEEGALAGFMTLRDIMKGRRAGQMHAPVKAYMTRKVIHGSPGTTFREMEELLLSHNIGHLPILEGGEIVGIVSRTDYLAHRREEREQAKAVQESLS
jgi:tRNA nucleotidyltransferase (CCA-adding enzyme)